MQDHPFDPHALHYFRNLLFPAITQGIITGYNVYHQRKESTAPYVINYLHSDLGFLPDGRPQPHREELLHVLNKFGPATIEGKIADSILDRMATYRLGDWKENPPNLQFYGIDGKLLSQKDFLSYRGPVIVEGNQYDLEVEITNKKDLARVLTLFEKHVYFYKLDKTGTLLSEQNPDAIEAAWVIPLFTITSVRPTTCNGFSPVTELAKQYKHYNGKTLVKDTPITKRFFKNNRFSRRKKLVNNLFFRNYL